jgi:hypothetical protein
VTTRARRLASLLLAGLAALALGGVSEAQAKPRAVDARLQGAFTAHGVVTHSVNVPGERHGERLTRGWSFVPQCPTGVCSTVQLLRQRGPHGLDRIVLHRRRRGYYTGRGSFTAPARCSHRVVAAGERVPFTITLTIVGAAVQGSETVATGFTATYLNRKRVDLTRCYLAPAHDSARYIGTLNPPPAT